MEDFYYRMKDLFPSPLIFYLSCGVLVILVILIFVALIPSNGRRQGRGKYEFTLYYGGRKRKKIVFYNPFVNFLIYGGAGSGKTKSVGKPLMGEFIRHDFAGFIYDFKDFDLTRTAYHFVKKHKYSYKFYYISFIDMNRTYRTNPIDPCVVNDRDLFLQLISDFLMAYLKGGKQDEWFNGALGILKGVAIRFYDDYPDRCTIPHIITLITTADKKQLTEFLKGNMDSMRLASAFLNSEDSERTQASYLSSVSNYLSGLSFNKKIAYVLTGVKGENDYFDFNLIDPDNPKLVSVANSYSIQEVISPVIALMITMSSRRFDLRNEIDFFYLLDEATTFKISDFEGMPSVLREYNVAFITITQSASKIERLYSRLELNSIQSNMGNQFYGRTVKLQLKVYR